jgi:hypothetical protein
MDELVKKSHNALVFYNAHLGVYKKVFTPSWWRLSRSFLRMKRHPGYHYAHIAEALKLAGISTPPVVKVSHYSVSTRAVDGILLFEALLSSDSQQIRILLKKYVKTVAAILSANLYFSDFHFKNFLVHKDELYALDLDNYYAGYFSQWRIKRLFLVSGYNRVSYFVNRLKAAARQGGNSQIIQTLESEVNPALLWQSICSTTMCRGKIRD